jgi:hypothetical protein
MWWLAGCGPATPDAWEGVEQAVVWDAGVVVVDRYAARTREDGAVLRTVDRCLWELDPRGGVAREARCVVGPDTRSVLSRRGRHLVDERIDGDHRRTLALLDPDTLRPTATLAVGLEPEGRVPGGSLFVDGDALLLFANHGLSGVEVPDDDDGRATYTVERWDGGALTWRRGLTRYPQEAHHVPGALAVLDQGEWRLYDAATGAVRRAPAPALPGACLHDGGLRYLSSDVPAARVTIPLDGAAPALTDAGPLPGWVGACVIRDGRPWFHGGDADGNGWVLRPDGVVDTIPRVDLELGAHVDGDGAWWVVELGRGYVVWDPEARAVRAPPRELHDVVRAGEDLVAYGVGVDLVLWLRSRAADWRRPHRVSPRSWHVADGRLWTFAHRVVPGHPAIEVLDLPGLEPAARWEALPR